MRQSGMGGLHRLYHACGIAGLRFELAWLSFTLAAKMMRLMSAWMDEAQGELTRLIEQAAIGPTPTLPK